MISLVTTTEAHRLTIPNGTSASPGLPGAHLYELDDLAYATYEGEENTATTWTLILVLAAAVAMLLARVQHLEHLMEDPLHKGKPAPSTLPAPHVPAQLETDLADVASRLRRLEENAELPPVTASLPPAVCPLTVPTLPFFQAKFCKVQAPNSWIDYLDPNDYLAYELAVQQGDDSICQWFIHDVLNPTLAGRAVNWEGTGLGRRSQGETDTLLNERFKFRIYQSRRAQDYDLLVYEDDRIYVPRRGRHALIQAAHAAAHQGMGSTRSLLERSFYWPYMACDARRFVETCRAVQAVKPLSTQHARPNLFPAEAPPQATKLDAVTRRTIRNVPDYDGPRGAEKVQVELRRVPPPPEQPDPLAGVREAVHQTSEPSSFVKTVKSVPDWDGPRGAEKIQVELRRSPANPEAASADHECPPTEEGEQGAVYEESPVQRRFEPTALYATRPRAVYEMPRVLALRRESPCPVPAPRHLPQLSAPGTQGGTVPSTYHARLP